MESELKNIETVDTGVVKKSKKRVLIASISIIVFIAVGVVVYFATRVSVQEWLDRFERGLVSISQLQDKNGETYERDIVKSIDIVDSDGVLKVQYNQRLQVYETNGQTSAYLSISEVYPSIDSSELDIFDEYYFAFDKMYTRRINGDDVVISSFDSSIDTLMQVASENIGGARYNFRKEYFDTLSNNKSILQHKNKMHILQAQIKDSAGFFGVSFDDTINDVSIYYQMNSSNKLVKFELDYMDNQNSVSVAIISNESKEISKPNWVV